MNRYAQQRLTDAINSVTGGMGFNMQEALLYASLTAQTEIIEHLETINRHLQQDYESRR